jgi:hypothetical protein
MTMPDPLSISTPYVESLIVPDETLVALAAPEVAATTPIPEGGPTGARITRHDGWSRLD